MLINLKNSSGLKIETTIGFSWTMLIFGAFVPLFRGDIKWFFASIVLAFFTWGVAWFIVPFFYNSVYIKGLLASGFQPADENSEKILKENGYLI